MNNCIFCRIVSKEAPGKIVFESRSVLGIVPLDQVSNGHTLLIPKSHFENILDIDEAILAKLAVYSKQLSSQLLKKHSATGINLLHASGKDAQQSVFHFHLHVVPRYKDDGLDLWIKQGL